MDRWDLCFSPLFGLLLFLSSSKIQPPTVTLRSSFSISTQVEEEEEEEEGGWSPKTLTCSVTSGRQQEASRISSSWFRRVSKQLRRDDV